MVYSLVMKPYQKIVQRLQTAGIKFTELNHEPVYTLEDSAKVEGLAKASGAKSLLLKTKHGYILVVLSGDDRLDSKKLKKALVIKDIRFASPAEVQQVMGCIIGACYPFGSIADIPTYLDAGLTRHAVISFNPGLHDKSIQIGMDDFLKLEQPTQLDLAAD